MDTQSKETRTPEARPSLWREFFHFLRENKKWWLLPIVLTILILGLILFLAGSPVAPFIYPLF